MRTLVTFVLVCCSLLVASAQDTILALSNSATAVRIIDPARQLTEFSPMLGYLDDVLTKLPVQAGAQANPLTKLREAVATLTDTPGINAKGEFWIVSLPPTDEALAVLQQAMRPDQNGNVNQEQVASAMESLQQTYLIAPLTDPTAFMGYRQTVQNTPAGKRIAGPVCGSHVITRLSNGETPSFTDIAFDITLVSKRDLVISSQYAQMKLPFPQEGMMTAIFAPVMKMIGDMQSNIERLEIGVAMQGANLSIETFTIPVEGSPLAQSIAAPAPAHLAAEYAGYLPEKLAYCSASDPMLSGAPGVGALFTKMMFGFLGLILPQERMLTLSDSVDTLSAQCSQGRAIGITAPSPTGQDGPTLIGVYRVTNAEEMGGALQNFVSEFQAACGELMNGMMGDVVKVTIRPAVETAGDISIDLVQLTVDTSAGKEAASPLSTIAFECRLARVDDKMLVTMGAQGAVEMANLVTRIQQQQPGFTNHPRYKALKDRLPAGTRGFQSLATLDLARAAVCMVPMPEMRNQGLQVLRVFPSQQSPITIFQEARDGMLCSEALLPNEQVQFLFTMLNSLLEIGMAQRGMTAE